MNRVAKNGDKVRAGTRLAAENNINGKAASESTAWALSRDRLSQVRESIN